MPTEHPTLTHIDPATNQPQMVDVSAKTITKRSATARSILTVGETILAQLTGGDIQTKKGPVFQTAIIAGTMAAKKTSELIPFCHPIGLDNCKILITVSAENEIVIECTATVTAKTGVEMEALTGASVAALTVYDMCKALSHDIVIRETRLLQKTGGKSDFKHKG
ncbi:MAG: cyclic pyranopterin monophosphate synthase MoaC [Sphingobacteriales bacterium]|nr:MAG: cyclic pyranopterin monophosphate synthase MoaC [Sphingobacteriales bacterium]